MVLNTAKWTGAAALVCGLAFTGVGVVARQGAKEKKDDAPPALNAVPDTVKRKAPAEILDDKVVTPDSNPKKVLGDSLARSRKAAARMGRCDQSLHHDELRARASPPGLKATDGCRAITGDFAR